MLEYMTKGERDEIETIVIKYQQAFKDIPYKVPNKDGPRDSVEIVSMFTTIIRRFAHYMKQLDDFKSLSSTDQLKLLRASVLEMCMLRSALSFDLKNNRWPDPNNELMKNCPQLRVSINA